METAILNRKPTSKLEGKGAILQLAGAIQKAGINRLLIVTEKKLRHAGVVKKVTQLLEEAGIHYIIYDAMKPTPTIENVNDGHDLFYGLCCDGLLSIGGCCQEHVAKAIKLVDALGDTICGCEGACKSRLKEIPVIAVNTSDCASSQLHETMIKDDAGELKRLMEANACAATITINDPDLFISAAMLN